MAVGGSVRRAVLLACALILQLARQPCQALSLSDLIGTRKKPSEDDRGECVLDDTFLEITDLPGGDADTQSDDKEKNAEVQR